MKEYIQKFFAFVTKLIYGRKYYKRCYEIDKELHPNCENMTANDSTKSVYALAEVVKAYD